MLALIIRVLFYTLAGAIGWTSAITMTGPDNACINIPAFADAISGGADGRCAGCADVHLVADRQAERRCHVIWIAMTFPALAFGAFLIISAGGWSRPD